MKALEEKIVREGTCIGDDILKVDSFLNHCIDVKFMDEIGEEYYRLFSKYQPNKILTIETSGIMIASAASRVFGYLPVVFAKKSAPSTMIEGAYISEAKSFTKGTSSIIRVSKEYLGPDDRLLIVDDFLASGNALIGLKDIAEQAGAKIAGAAIAIEKSFQDGGNKLRATGMRVESLARIASMSESGLEFVRD